MIVLPILRSSPCLVVGIPVALAMFLLSTSTPKALLGENDVPGMLKIFICVSFIVDAKICFFNEQNVRPNCSCNYTIHLLM